jgi:hypothetical protein
MEALKEEKEEGFQKIFALTPFLELLGLPSHAWLLG